MEPIATIIMPTVDLDRAGETLAMSRATAGVETSAFLYWDFKPRGAVWSSNALFKAALHMETPYVAYMNDDTVPEQQDWLKLMIGALERDAKFGWACPSGECSTNPQRSGRPGDPFEVHVVKKPMAWFVAVIKRECLEDVGGFWEELIHYGDESDWIQRAFRKGWKQIWTRGVYIRHNKQGGGEMKSLRNVWAGHDKRLYRKRWVGGKKKTKAQAGNESLKVKTSGLLKGSQFSCIAGTGRTGSHWLQKFIQVHAVGKVQTFHDGLPNRLKHRPSARWQMANYLLNLEAKAPGAEVYVECNPALLEWVMLDHPGGEVLPAGMLDRDSKVLLAVRHPYGYVKSIKAKAWAWNWHKKPGCTIKGWQTASLAEKASKAWAFKNRLILESFQHVPYVRFEDLFSDGGAVFVRDALETLGIETDVPDEQIEHELGYRAAPKGGWQTPLTDSEKGCIVDICGPMMGEFGYDA